MLPFHRGRTLGRTRSSSADTMMLYRLALRRCVVEGVDAIVLLGDLSESGSVETLQIALGMAAETSLPAWVVPGNHDVKESSDALTVALRRIGACNVRLAGWDGEASGDGFGGLRVAGLSVEGGTRGHPVSGSGGVDIEEWGENAVVLLSHYPVVSSRARVEWAGLEYAGDLAGSEGLSGTLVARPAPTVVLGAHLHLRDALVEGSVLQLSCGPLVEPPFEVTFLDIEVEGSRVAVRRESVPVISSPDGQPLPVLSPAEDEWVFEAGTWISTESEAVHDEQVRKSVARRSIG